MPTSAKSQAKKPVKSAATKEPPAVVKASAKAPAKAPAKASVAKKPAGKRGNGGSANTSLPPEQRRNYVEVAAYFIAERHGFMPGRELADWAAAEAEIDRLLTEGRLHF